MSPIRCIGWLRASTDGNRQRAPRPGRRQLTAISDKAGEVPLEKLEEAKAILAEGRETQVGRAVHRLCSTPYWSGVG